MISRNVLGFSVAPHMRRVMSLNGFHASIMRADKKKKKDGSGLPKGLPIPVMPVDCLKVKPDSWVGGAGSYVVPVDSEWGLWFNWSMNNKSRTAVLCSVKGMNPVTGQRIGGYGLEKIDKKCPTHDIDLYAHNYCPECDFNWPEQNYISSPNPLFLDGFRTPDGNVRQFYFTDEMTKSIPELVIGKEDTVPAFGFCFYDQKEGEEYEDGSRIKDEVPQWFAHSNPAFTLRSSGSSREINFRDMIDSASLGIYIPSKDDVTAKSYFSHEDIPDGSDCLLLERNCSDTTDMSDTKITYTSSSDSGGIIRCGGLSAGTRKKENFMRGAPKAYSASVMPDGLVEDTSFSEELKMSVPPVRKSAEVGIGAGAKIKQAFKKSRLGVDTWQEKPSSVVRLYFVFQEQFEEYVSAGLNDLVGTKDGYMDGLPVGGL